MPLADDSLGVLGDEEASLYRSITMRLGHLSLGRPDWQLGAKECASGMAEPTLRHLAMLKRATTPDYGFLYIVFGLHIRFFNSYKSEYRVAEPEDRDEEK